MNDSTVYKPTARPRIRTAHGAGADRKNPGSGAAARTLRAFVLGALITASGCGQESPPTTLETPQQPESFAGSPLPAPATHAATGTVVSVEPQQITIAHDALPGLDWPPMTMTFAIDAELLNRAGLQPGDKVAFTLAESNGQYSIRDISRR